MINNTIHYNNSNKLLYVIYIIIVIHIIYINKYILKKINDIHYIPKIDYNINEIEKQSNIIRKLYKYNYELNKNYNDILLLYKKTKANINYSSNIIINIYNNYKILYKNCDKNNHIIINQDIIITNIYSNYIITSVQKKNEITPTEKKNETKIDLSITKMI